MKVSDSILNPRLALLMSILYGTILIGDALPANAQENESKNNTDTAYMMKDWENLKTPEDIAVYLSGIEYDRERFGHTTRTPENTASLGRGVCRDIAMLGYEILESRGYEAKIFVVEFFLEEEDGSRGPWTSHAVVSYKDSAGELHYINHSPLVSRGYGNLDEMERDLIEEMGGIPYMATHRIFTEDEFIEWYDFGGYRNEPRIREEDCLDSILRGDDYGF